MKKNSIIKILASVMTLTLICTSISFADTQVDNSIQLSTGISYTDGYSFDDSVSATVSEFDAGNENIDFQLMLNNHTYNFIPGSWENLDDVYLIKGKLCTENKSYDSEIAVKAQGPYIAGSIFFEKGIKNFVVADSSEKIKAATNNIMDMNIQTPNKSTEKEILPENMSASASAADNVKGKTVSNNYINLEIVTPIGLSNSANPANVSMRSWLKQEYSTSLYEVRRQYNYITPIKNNNTGLSIVNVYPSSTSSYNASITVAYAGVSVKATWSGTSANSYAAGPGAFATSYVKNQSAGWLSSKYYWTGDYNTNSGIGCQLGVIMNGNSTVGTNYKLNFTSEYGIYNTRGVVWVTRSIDTSQTIKCI